MSKKSILATIKWLNKQGITTLYGVDIKDFVREYKKQVLYKIIFVLFVIFSTVFIFISLQKDTIYTILTLVCLVIIEYVFITLKLDDRYTVLPYLHKMKKKGTEVTSYDCKISANLLQVISQSKGNFNGFINNSLGTIDIELDGIYDTDLLENFMLKLKQVKSKDTLDKLLKIFEERSSDNNKELELYFSVNNKKVKFITLVEKENK